MRVQRQDALVIRKALKGWRQAGLLDEDTVLRLDQSLQTVPFDWQKLAAFSFWISLACIAVAASAVLADQYLIDLVEALFHSGHGLLSAMLAVLAGGVFTFGIRTKRAHPDRVFSNEAILFCGVLGTAGAVAELGQAIDDGSGHFSLLILLSCAVYAALGYGFKSNLIWLFALLSLGGWMGAETGYASGWGSYYLGMNYPLRFTLFGAGLTVAPAVLWQSRSFAPLRHTTLVTGLLYLFTALWLLSIFGNTGDIDAWDQTTQTQLLGWSVLFAVAAGAAVYHGLRYDDATTKGFGLTFLFINLYTRYFEYFWNSPHKAVFFTILAISFWLLGRRAEKIWRLGESAGD
jgi:hypothetical protein